MTLTVSDLFALSCSTSNSGDDQCHWCGSKCERRWMHDDLPPIPFHPTTSKAMHPSKPYICHGCWNWRSKRTCIKFLDGSFKDGQCPMNHSWWIERKGKVCESLAIKNKEEKVKNIHPFLSEMTNEDDYKILHKKLLEPPLCFSLSIILNPILSGKLEILHATENHIQMGFVNENKSIRADTILDFTINNIKHQYCVYELEQAMKHGTDGKMPGVGALGKLFGIPAQIEPSGEKKMGRPPDKERNSEKAVRRVVKEATV